MTKFLYIGIAVLVLALQGETAKAGSKDECYICHETMGDKPSKAFKGDVHYQNGVTCASCHGGDASKDDMDEAMNKKIGFGGVPFGDRVSEICSSCHSDSVKMGGYGSKLPTHQLEMLQASAHGKLAISGKQRLVQCTTCHNAHGIASVKSPASPVHPLRIIQTCGTCHSNATFMRLYNPSLPVDQIDKYKTSVHGMKNAKGDTKTAVCSSCHGSHDIQPASSFKSHVNAANLPETCGKCHSDAEYMKAYGIPTDQVEKFKSSVHGKALLVKRDLSAPACNDCHGNHGAVPPGVESISKVCGQCHALNAELFSSSPHKKAFDENNFPECETCHGKHDIGPATVSMVGVDSVAVCHQCHTMEKNVKGYKIALSMRQLLDSLGGEEVLAKQFIEEAEQKGMEISEAKFKLRDVNQARLQSRTMVHAFNQDKFREVLAPGLQIVDVVKGEAMQAVEEYSFRRWGLGISTLIITILAISLYVYIRRLEATQAREQSGQQH